MTQSPKSTFWTGAALVGLAIGVNLPYARLATIFDYPGILRQPPEVILATFSAGGAPLIATWYAFALAALLFMPVSLAHAFAGQRLTTAPALAISAALIGVLSGLLQAMGLLRWVLVVPGLADTGDTAGLALIHAYAGVTLGEHLGQILTAGHLALIVALQQREGAAKTALLGALAAALILAGAMEGPALALGGPADWFGLCAIAGYLALTLWMILSGLSLLRGQTVQTPGVALQ